MQRLIVLSLTAIAMSFASLSCGAQSQFISLDYPFESNRSITTLWDYADVLPLDDQQVVAVLSGGVAIAKFDLTDGSLLKTLDVAPLDAYVCKFVENNNFSDSIIMFTNSSINAAPTCQKHRYIFKHIFPIEGSDKLLAEVSSSLAYPSRVDYPFWELPLVIIFDNDLNIEKISRRENYQGIIPGKCAGGGTFGDSVYIEMVTTNYSDLTSESELFSVFKLENGQYKFKNNLPHFQCDRIGDITRLRMFPRAAVKQGDKYFTTDSKRLLVQADVLSQEGTVLELPIAENAYLAFFDVYAPGEFIAYIGYVDRENMGTHYELVIANEDFSNIEVLGTIDYHMLVVKSLASHNCKAYTYIFNQVTKEPLVHIVDVEWFRQRGHPFEIRARSSN